MAKNTATKKELLSNPKSSSARTEQTRISTTPSNLLEDVAAHDERLMAKLARKVKLEPALSRQIVSFQANKLRSKYRWYKYKEGFSAALVEDFLHRYKITAGKILDPFAGSGTTMFAASSLGVSSPY